MSIIGLDEDEEYTVITETKLDKDEYNDDPNKPRNLKLHTGRLTKEKEEKIAFSYNEGVNECETQIYGESAFHLKFGFSNTQITLSHLVRLHPYTKMFIEYNGKLDHPDRMVSNYQDLWRKVCNVAQCNTELIPEWFYLPEMLMNHNFCYFGERNNGEIVSDIALPPWAKEDPFRFVMQQRKFIENSRLNKNINVWIELLFGRRQQSEKEFNIFFEMCSSEYFKSISKTELFDRMLLRSVSEFFQLPSKLFDKKHPRLYCEKVE